MLYKRYGQVVWPFRHLFVWRQDRLRPASLTIAANSAQEQRYRRPNIGSTFVPVAPLIPTTSPQSNTSTSSGGYDVPGLFHNRHALDTSRDYFVA